jgi:hypothetical protein
MKSNAQSKKSFVEVLYGPWHGRQGVLQEHLTPHEWLVRLLDEDQDGEILLALEACQFRPIAL